MSSSIRRRVGGLLSPGKTLSQRVFYSGIWVFATRIAQLLVLARTIILARLLVPSDFGVMGIVLLAMSFLDTFSQTGFQAALVQNKESTEGCLDTAWTVSVIRGIVLFAALFFGAPYVALFFKSPQANLILRFVGISMLLKGFTNIGIVYFQKELEFHKQFIYQFSVIVADFVIVVLAAFILRSVWALVFGLLAGNIVGFIMSYLIHPYRPHLAFDPQRFKELFSFGKWVFASHIVVFLAIQGDNAFLGRALGIATLGLYQMAFRFADLPCSQIGALSRVAFPAYSKLQDNIPRLRSAYLKMVRFIVFLSMPVAGGIFILGSQFTQILLGDKWMSMVPALRILSISAAIRVIVGTGGALFYARGRPDINFKMNLARAITLAVTLYPLTVRWKISGTSLAVLLATCACIPIWIIGSMREIKVKIGDYLEILLFPLIGTVIMSVVICALGIALDQSRLMGLLISVLVGIITYFVFGYFSQSILNYSVFEDMRSMLSSIRLETGQDDEKKNAISKTYTS